MRLAAASGPSSTSRSSRPFASTSCAFADASVASAIATLAGRGGGGIVEGFRDRLGLDSFDVTTDNQGNAAVQAGIYLTDQIYTEAIVSADETEINLNFDVTRDVTLRGSVTSEGDNAIGIYFERDY